MSSIIVFRHANFQPNLQQLRIEAEAMVETCRYKKIALDDEAPAVVNCITAVRYLLQKSTGLKIASRWMGGLVRGLVSSGWKITLIKSTELQSGDLLLLRKEAYHSEDPDQNYITHIQMALSSNEIFHATWRDKKGPVPIKKGVKIEPPNDFSRVIDEPHLALCYIDPRNLRVRALLNGKNLDEVLALKAIKGRTFNIGKDIGTRQWLPFPIPRSPILTSWRFLTTVHLKDEDLPNAGWQELTKKILVTNTLIQAEIFEIQSLVLCDSENVVKSAAFLYVVHFKR